MPKRGGKRLGAGRPLGSGKYGEPTVPVRVPKSMRPRLGAWLAGDENVSLPHYADCVAAGDPARAGDDSSPASLSIEELIGAEPDTDFTVHVRGQSMVGAGIDDGDLLVVNAKADAKPGDVVVAICDGETTVKRLKKVGGRLELHPENPAHKPIRFVPGSEVMIQGVVKAVIKTL